MKQLLQVFFLIPISLFLQAQSFVNGSFETTTAPMSCQYNLVNTSFNSMMSSVRGYGAGDELDILVAGCYNPSIPHGVRAVGIADFPSDEISIPVTPTLVAGQTYSFTFRAYAELSFRTRGDIQIGASTSNTAFGTLIYTGVTNASAWKLFTVTFTAPVNATHITVRNIVDGVVHWNHVDDFRFIILLPIHIQRFDAKLQNKEVDLSWETETEENNDYFEVERSVDGVEWVKLETVDGAGNSNSPKYYRSIDPSPVSGVNYYRLAQVDFDGSKTYSEVRAVEYIDEAAAGLQLYPNPTTGVLHIRFSDAQEHNSVSVIDAMGKVVLEQHNNAKEIDLQRLAAGIYWIQVNLTNGKRLTRKIVKI